MARASEGIRTWQSKVDLKQDDLPAVWAEFRKTGSETLRNLLVEHYLPLVKANSERLWSKLPDEVQLDDLISAGCDGLRDAIEMFDLKRGVKFETYCGTRIKGAILDALRNSDWVPRLVRHRATQLAQCRHKLQNMLGRTPTHHELAQAMSLSEKDFERLRRDASAVGMFSLDRKFADTDSSRDIREADLVADRKAEDPLHHMQQDDIRRLITKGLAKNERLILLLYYYEGMTMKEIGATLKLSESRVSQMHTAILERLKGQLGGRADDFAVA
jgi:RNA polymerase sigma factor for flagellar operon FliA